MHYEAIMRAFNDSAWAITRAKMEQIVALLELKMQYGHGIPSAYAGGYEDDIEEERQTPGIAVIPMCGTIMQKASLMTEYSGGVSTERLGSMLSDAMNDPEIAAVLLDIDSPGGVVYGVGELAETIFRMRGKKPIWATVHPLCASAAYWIASAAEKIHIQPSGECGGIGVIIAHIDKSKMFAEEGIKHTFIIAGEYKSEGNQAEPLSDEATAFLQSRVDSLYGQFVEAVAKHRGVSVQTVTDDFGKGRCLDARESLRVGMVDKVATMDETLQEMAGIVARKKRTDEYRGFFRG